MCETPLGFLRLDAIAGHPRLAALVGTSDLVKDLHARHTPGREETLLARSLAIMAARAHGLAALDGVHLTWTMTRAWRWPASKAATRASTARR